MSRITREVVARFLKELGCAVQSVGQMRRFAKFKAMDDTDADEVSTEDSGVLTPNNPVEESTRHRLKWVTQVCEYWLPSKVDTLWDEETLELKPHLFTPSHPLLNTGEASCWILAPYSPSSRIKYSLFRWINTR